jgi:hypothetical protein
MLAETLSSAQTGTTLIFVSKCMQKDARLLHGIWYIDPLFTDSARHHSPAGR